MRRLEAADRVRDTLGMREIGMNDTVLGAIEPLLTHRERLLRARRWSGWILMGYLMALFTGTHVPNPAGLLPIEANDKWLHFSAYFGLAFLLATWRSRKAAVTWCVTSGIWTLVVVLGIADELTQMIPGINRHCELLDWIADLSGATCGLGIWHLLRRGLFAGGGVKLHEDAVQK